MPHILLLGAGFSRNWGGWLSREVSGDLAGRLQGDPELLALLNRAPNFEDALVQLQNEYLRSGRAEARAKLERFQRAVVETFAAMNAAFAKIVDFEFQNSIELTVRTFLMKFDAIFTLNQDLLMEFHYLNDNIMLGSPGRWQGWEIPGTFPIHDPNLHPVFDRERQRRRVASEPFARDPRFQPYFKLHGSTNWEDTDGGSLLVIGSNKVGTIRKHRILGWYGEQFARYMAESGSRLMVIGYGFMDAYINQMIADAGQGSGLQMFVVHPDGREAIRRANPTWGKPIYVPEPIEEVPIIGESQRPLSTTFGGKDPVEHDKLKRFFAAA